MWRLHLTVLGVNNFFTTRSHIIWERRKHILFLIKCGPLLKGKVNSICVPSLNMMYLKIRLYKGRWLPACVKCYLFLSQMDCTTAEIFQKENCAWSVTCETCGNYHRSLVGCAVWLHHWGWHQGTSVQLAALILVEYTHGSWKQTSLCVFYTKTDWRLELL